MVKYREVNPDFWSYDKEGDYVEGVLMKKQENVGKNKSHLYSLNTKEGFKNVWGATILDKRMEFVDVGSVVKITYQGLTQKKDGSRVAKMFKVELVEEEE